MSNENNTVVSQVKSLCRNFVFAARNGFVSRVSYDPTPVASVDGKFGITVKSELFETSSDETNEFAILRVLNIHLAKCFEFASFTKGSRIKFIVPRNVVNRFAERVNLVTAGALGENIGEMMVKSWMSPSEAYAIREFASMMGKIPCGAVIEFMSHGEVDVLENKGHSPIARQNKTLCDAYDYAWSLLPEDEVAFDEASGF